METNTTAMPTGIRPVDRPQGSQATGIQRRGGTAAQPFAPRTDVSLQNSIADVAGLLSKIASTKEDAMDKLSPQLQKLIDKIMQQSFSLESTLAEGLGTTLESQRFAIDQLFTLARLLHQMGTLSEQGKPAALSDALQALLSNFKELLAADEGNGIEPMMLHKLAFEVLGGMQAEELPTMMQFLLAQQAAPQAESDALGFLKQLIDYLLPRPSEGETAARTGQGAGQESADGTAAEAGKGAESQNAPEARPAQAQGAAGQSGAEGARQAPQGQQAQTTSHATERSTANSYTWENTGAEKEAGARQPAEVNPQDPFAELMRKGIERMRGRLQQPAQAQQGEQEQAPSQSLAGRVPEPPPMQNTPRAMETMRQLASLLLKDAELTPEDERLLAEFVNNKQAMLAEEEAKELQMLLSLCAKNVPASVRQSAQQQGLEDMARLWAFMELCDLANIRERDPKALKRASKSLSDFASMMKNSMLPENGRTAEGHRSMSFMTPLYMSDEMRKPYPAYIHVYDEEQKDENGGPSKKETWIRVCLLTDNIGAVDVSFRMYEGSNLDVRIYFSERENIEEFRGYMDEFRASFDDKPLTLMSVKVGVAGAKA